MSVKISFLLIFFVVLLLPPVNTQAATVIWTGSASTDWGTATNWNTETVPSQSDDVIIADVTNDPTIDLSRTINTLTINTGGLLNLNGNNLTVSGNLTVNGTLDASTGTPTITVAGNWDSSTGTFSYKQSGVDLGSTVVMTGISKTIKTPSDSNTFGLSRFYNLEINGEVASREKFRVYKKLSIIKIAGYATIPKLTMDSYYRIAVNWGGDIVIDGGILAGQSAFYMMVNDESRDHVSVTNGGRITVAGFKYMVHNGRARVTAAHYEGSLFIWAEVPIPVYPAEGAVAVLGPGVKLEVDNNTFVSGAFYGDEKVTLDNTVYNTAMDLKQALVIGDDGVGNKRGEFRAGSAAISVNRVFIKAISTAYRPDIKNKLVAGSSTWNISGTYWKNFGEFDKGTSTVNFTSGSAGNTILSGGAPFHDVIFNNVSGSWILQDGMTANSLTSTMGGDLVFNAGSAYAITNIALNGSSGNQVNLSSTIPANSWNLNVTNITQPLSYVGVADSNAANQILCTNNCLDNNRNTNWIFFAYALNYTKAGTGSGTVSSSPEGINSAESASAAFNGNTVVTLTATPSTGSTFAGWSGDADCTDGSVTMIGEANCTATFTLTLADADNDGILDDIDGNGINGENPCRGGNKVNCDDNCMDVSNTDQLDFDFDGIGNVCDLDIDGDGVNNQDDAFPFDPMETADSDKEIPVIVGSGFRYTPKISGNIIVWSEYKDGNYDIYMYDITTGVETRVTTDPAEQGSPDVSGNRIVFDDERNGNWDIYLYDISTGTETRITNDPADQYQPVISGDYIVWPDTRNENNDIYMYNISTEIETRVTTDLSEQGSPDVSGNRIVFDDERNGNWDIYLYDISTGTETRITNNPANQYQPVISGDYIVWVDTRNGNEDIYMYDIATETVTPITSDSADQHQLTISGNYIVWKDTRNGDDDIYMYDIATATETQITFDPADQYLPAISGEYIVWIDRRNGPREIYMYTGSGDGIGDNADNCPDVYNPKADWIDINGSPHIDEQPDYDLDNIGDACDPDDDNDLMPDDWEVENGLNPLMNDAGLDPDRDGATNLEEYQNGTDPQLNAMDADNDGILNDIDGNGISGENPCRGGNTDNCDDNCIYVANPLQEDSDNDGYGDACTISHCVNNSADLQLALTDAESNGSNNLIKLVKGTYRTSENDNRFFYYYSDKPYGLIVQGGYSSDCTVRDNDASSTVLDGVNMSDGVIGLEAYPDSAVPTHVKLHVDGVAIKNGWYGLMMSSGSAQLEISNNIIRNNYEDPLGAWSDSGNIVVTNNLIYDNNVTMKGEACELSIYEAGKLYVANNTITENNSDNRTFNGRYRGALNIYLNSENAKASILNNIVFNNGSTDITINGVSGNTPDVAYVYNNYYRLLRPYGININQAPNINLSIITDPFFQDPLFVNKLNNDYHLSSTSPLIDRGNDSARLLTEVDFEGDNRKFGNSVDIGADEYTLYDSDGDGYRSDEDCNDNDILTYPGAPEICNGIDNDCDGIIDVAGCSVTWDGSESTSWDDPLNWNPEFIPSANHTVIIPQNASVSLSEDVEVNMLTIGTGSSLILNGYNLTVNGDIIINGTLDASSGTSDITITGNWENHGDFIAGLSTVRLVGTGQSIYGSTTFHNLEKISDTGDTLTFEAGSTQTFTGELTLNGTDGNLLSLESSELGRQYTIDPQSTYQISFVNMSDLSSTTQIIAYDSENLGNNDHVTLDIPPMATTNPASNINGDSAVLYASVNPNASQTTVYFDWGTDTSYGHSTPGQSIGNGTVNTTVAEFITGLAPNTVYHFRARAVNAAGEVTGSDASFRTSLIVLNITYPSDIAAIERPDTMVSGTIINGTNYETGVTVNGVVAVVYGNQFFVNHLPLVQGSNTITVNAVDVNGNTVQKEINVVADIAQPYVTLNSNIESGISPIDAYFSVDTAIPNSVSTYQLDNNYNGTTFHLDYDDVNFNNVMVQYTTEGVHYPTIAVTDDQNPGTTYFDMIAIVVQNKAQLDELLHGKWEGMKTALGNQDIETSLNYFVYDVRDTYRQMFNQFGFAKISSILSRNTDFKLSVNYGRVLECGAIKTEDDGTSYSYPVHFVLDENGLWKIGGF